MKLSKPIVATRGILVLLLTTTLQWALVFTPVSAQSTTKSGSASQPTLDQPSQFHQAGNKKMMEKSHPLENQLRLSEPELSAPLLLNAPVSPSVQQVSPVFSTTRIEAIHQRIDTLQKLLLRQQAEAEAARAQTLSAIQAQIDRQTDPVTSTDKPIDDTTSIQPQPLPKIIDPVPQKAHVENLDPEKTMPTEQPEKSNPADTGIIIFSTPVNSFEMANSLFATRHYAQALKSYESLLLSETSDHDSDWLKCLAANCYRIEGDLPKAEVLYRSVISSREKSYASDYSQWFLNHISTRKQIQVDLQNFTDELQSYNPEDSQ